MARSRPALPSSCAFTTIESPVGNLLLIASEQGLHALLRERDLKDRALPKAFKRMREDARHPVLVRAKRQLLDYFSGKRAKLELPLLLDGTAFQRRTWKLVAKLLELDQH